MSETNVTYKPAGYTSVSPYLVVSDARLLIEFLVSVFDAHRLRQYDRPDGSVMHAEMRIDDSIVMIGESPHSNDAQTAHIHVYVNDVDGVYRRALDHGGVSIQEPTQKDGDPDRRGGVSGPCGNSWWISTQVSD